METEQLEAIHDDPSLIKNIENPSEALQLAAVRSDPDVIRYISTPSEDVQLEAISVDLDAARFIKNPCYKVLRQVYDTEYRYAWKNGETEMRELLDHINLQEDGSLVYDKDTDRLRELNAQFSRSAWKGNCDPLLRTIMNCVRFKQ